LVLAGFIKFNSAYFFLVGCWLCKRVFTLDCSGSLWMPQVWSGFWRPGSASPTAKIGSVKAMIVQKEGSLVSSGAMGRWHTPPPPVPAVPPSQTNDCKGFLRFKPSQSRPKSASSRPKGCGGVLLRVLSVRSAVEGGQFVRTRSSDLGFAICDLRFGNQHLTRFRLSKKFFLSNGD
jgi:hypothetical protein